MIPSTSLSTIKVNSGIEYKGKLFLSESSSTLPLNIDEIFVAGKLTVDKKITEKQPEFIAKLRQNKKKLGCEYASEIEKDLQNVEKNIYAIKI